MQAHNKDISQDYFQELIGLIALMIMNLQGRSTLPVTAQAFQLRCTEDGTQ
ncbi:MAG: hypothetical protein ACP5NC_05185 [Nitrososphaeria archaeon]